MKLQNMTDSMNRCVKHCAYSPPKLFKCCCMVLAGILVVELLLFNILFIYGYFVFTNSIFAFDVNKPIFEQLFKHPSVRDFVQKGKAGGFVSILQQTLERIYVTFPDKSGNSQTRIGSLGLDVSHSGEAVFIYNKILTRSQEKYPYKNLVIDIGANDGFVSSNSFNFIRWGWDAILVEPQHTQLQFARLNLLRYYNSRSNNNQSIKFVEALLGQKDDMVQFVQTNDIVSMEGHILQSSGDLRPPSKGDRISLVQSLTVRTFVEKYNVPKYFGILSIDAEGLGYVILHRFIELDFRPAYIIYEDLHEKHWELPVNTFRYLAEHGYKYLHKLGWNHILEHQME